MYNTLVNELKKKYDCTYTELFEALAVSKNLKLKEIVTSCNKCPKSVLNKYSDVISDIIISPVYSEEELYEYYDNNKYDEISLLRNPNCPSGLIEKILKSTNRISTYIYISKHPNTTSTLLSELWDRTINENKYEEEEFKEIRRNIIEHQNCPKRVRKAVINEGNDDEKISLLKYDDKITENMYQKIFDSRYSFTKKRKFNNKLDNNIRGLELALSRSKFCDKDHLKELVKEAELEEHIYIGNTPEMLMAINPNVLHKKTFIELSTKNDFRILECLLQNPSCPSEALVNIVNNDENNSDIKSRLFERILDHPHCNEEIYNMIADIVCKDRNAYSYDLKNSLINNKYVTVGIFERIVGVNLDKELDIKKEIENPKFISVTLETKENEETYLEKKELEIRELIDSIKKVVKNATLLESRYGVIKELRNSIDISEEILFLKIDNHYEIRPDCVEILPYLNLSSIDVTNLKVSGINFRGTNIRINPQVVFNKDLSNAFFDKENIVGDLTDCNIEGSNLLSELQKEPVVTR